MTISHLQQAQAEKFYQSVVPEAPYKQVKQVIGYG